MTTCIPTFRARPAICVLFLLGGAAIGAPAADVSCAPVPPSLVSWWRAENNAKDEEALNDGTLLNGTTFAHGLVGRAFSFDGVDDIVSVPDSQSLHFDRATPFTMEVWIYRKSKARIMHVMGKRSGCSVPFYQVAMDPGGGGMAFPEEMIPLRTWTHLAMTWDGTNALEYIDGKFVQTWDTGALGENSAPFEIGNSGTCQPFEGLVDEPSIYSRALTPTEIQSIVDARSAGKCVPPADIGGSATGFVGSKTVRCNNVTTGQIVDLEITGKRWNCTEAGLLASDGDTITESVTGVKGTWK